MKPDKNTKLIFPHGCFWFVYGAKSLKFSALLFVLYIGRKGRKDYLSTLPFVTLHDICSGLAEAK